MKLTPATADGSFTVNWNAFKHALDPAESEPFHLVRPGFVYHCPCAEQLPGVRCQADGGVF